MSIPVSARSSAGNPPDPLRSLWELAAERPAGPFRRPAILAAESVPQTRLFLSYHDLFRAASPEHPVQVFTWETAVDQTLPVGRGRLWLRGLWPGATVQVPFDRAGADLSAEATGRVELAYGLAVGSRLEVGVSAAFRGVVPRGEGMLHARLHPWQGGVLEGWFGREGRQQLLGVKLEERQFDLQVRNQLHSRGVSFATGLARWGDVRAGWEGEATQPEPALSPYAVELAYGLAVWRVGCRVPVAAGYSLNGEMRDRRLHSQLRGYLEGKRFAQGKPHFEDRGGALTLHRDSGGGAGWGVGVFANTGRFQLSSGRLENWPFIASSLSLVEGKLWSFWGRGGYRLWGAMLKWERRGSAWDWTLGSRFARAEGWAYLASRERLKANFASLLFPQKQEKSLGKWWELVDLTLGVGYRLSGWGISYRLDQLVPVRTSPAEGPDWEEKGGSRHYLTVFLEN